MANIDINMLQYISLQKSVAEKSDSIESSSGQNIVSQDVTYNNWDEFKRALEDWRVVCGDTVLDSSGDIYLITSSKYFTDENGEDQKKYTYEKLVTSK